MNFKIALLTLGVSFLITTISCVVVFAQVMTSTNYGIQSDSMNVGGERQTSNNYQAEDTIGEIATGISASTNYKLLAGYQQMQEVYIALSVPSSITMSPDIGGVSGGQSNGVATTTVTTDSVAGYTLSIRASASPALSTSSDSFQDYIPQSASIPDYSWSVPATTSEFGFTPEGSHIIQKFKDNGSDTCNTGSNNTSDTCWYNLSISDENIAQSYSSNHPAGTETVIKFRAESGTSHIQIGDTYTAEIVITTISN
jgi:hypothetical protein